MEPYLAHPTPSTPLALLQDKGQGSTTRKDKTSPQDTDVGGGRRLVCKSCRVQITTADQRIVVNGRHQHVFANPAGRIYELGCFATAPGCSFEAPASSQFSWFAGYNWQIALCRGCGGHLGWRFTNASSGGFYGLILPNLIEIGDKTR